MAEKSPKNKENQRKRAEKKDAPFTVIVNP